MRSGPGAFPGVRMSNMAFGEIPRGIEDMWIALVTGDTPGTWVDVPGIRSLEVSISTDSDRLEGDNRVIAVSPGTKELTGSIELGQINLAALAVMKGGTVATTGTTPNVVNSLEESDTVISRYFAIQAAAPSADASGSEYQIEIKKAAAVSGLDETLSVNEWNTPTIDFEGVGVSGVLLERRQYETAIGLDELND